MEMGFGQAVSTGFSKYVNFSDRASRSEYWYWTLFVALVSVVTTIIDKQLDVGIVSTIATLATFLPGLAVSVRRLHDIDRSGWWLLISVIPIVGLIVLLVFDCTEGTSGPNKYGPDPLAAGEAVQNPPYGAPA